MKIRAGMQWVLPPGYGICRRLSLPVNLAVIALLLALGQAGAYLPGGAAWGLALFAAGLYLLVALVFGLRFILRRIGGAAERIASGDLSMRLGRRSGGNAETDAIWAEIARMAGNLSSLVGEVRDGAESIRGGSREIAEGVAHLSQRTDRQASTRARSASRRSSA
ncbi:MAG: methyl-accepting chemotaxis protein [Betaproteobacteria bacterium]|nr:methyl-accepting chemotaxis protein [Betaproteobacteria bacterium]MDH5222220.1 methyl-accepting chemotaxis protein [Betaproteobacteria bacterium]MDH5351607.1 methyl-accepting chemotaxis protein [Betaproteobacteria bacterium]